MLYVAFTLAGETHSNLYSSWEDYYRDTFSPDADIKALVDFQISGKSYAERKESARQTAIDFQTEERPGLSYGELATIKAWFYRVGKRYGLLKEFSENAIC